MPEKQCCSFFNKPMAIEMLEINSREEIFYIFAYEQMTQIYNYAHNISKKPELNQLSIYQKIQATGYIAEKKTRKELYQLNTNELIQHLKTIPCIKTRETFNSIAQNQINTIGLNDNHIRRIKQIITSNILRTEQKKLFIKIWILSTIENWVDPVKSVLGNYQLEQNNTQDSTDSEDISSVNSDKNTDNLVIENSIVTKFQDELSLLTEILKFSQTNCHNILAYERNPLTIENNQLMLAFSQDIPPGACMVIAERQYRKSSKDSNNALKNQLDTYHENFKEKAEMLLETPTNFTP